MLFTVELANRLAARGVSANCLDPGTVNTKMLYAGWGPCGMSIQVLLPVRSVCVRVCVWARLCLCGCVCACVRACFRL